MPENEALVGARLNAVADALGTTAGRLVGGLAVGAVVLAAMAWTLLGGGSGSPGVDAAALPQAPSTAVSSRALVHVAGAVASPGVYRLGADARVSDVLDAAGGPLADADLRQLNLAAVLSDGERVYVPRQGEDPPPPVAGGGPPAGPLNLNTATAQQLDGLPGIGPATAEAIVSWRKQHGRFKSVDELLNVRGIGPAKLDAIRAEVRV